MAPWRDTTIGTAAAAAILGLDSTSHVAKIARAGGIPHVVDAHGFLRFDRGVLEQMRRDRWVPPRRTGRAAA